MLQTALTLEKFTLVPFGGDGHPKLVAIIPNLSILDGLSRHQIDFLHESWHLPIVDDMLVTH